MNKEYCPKQYQYFKTIFVFHGEVSHILIYLSVFTLKQPLNYPHMFAPVVLVLPFVHVVHDVPVVHVLPVGPTVHDVPVVHVVLANCINQKREYEARRN